MKAINKPRSILAFMHASIICSSGADFNGDGRTDFALMQRNWSSIPVAFSNGSGAFNLTNHSDAATKDFSEIFGASGTRSLSGDFNGDGKTDIVLLTGNSMPVAFSKGDGSFSIVKNSVLDFTLWARANNHGDLDRPPIVLLSADFNGDGRTDLALTGGVDPSGASSWNTTPVAFSQGDGTFRVTNHNTGLFSSWSLHKKGKRVFTGDFDGDGKADIGIVKRYHPETTSWNTIPIAKSLGDGRFSVTNYDARPFTSWMQEQSVECFPGDFNGDGKMDFALIKGAWVYPNIKFWNTIPVAFSNGDGTFDIKNKPGDWNNFLKKVGDFNRLSVGDFNGDGKDDFAYKGTNFLSIAQSNGDGSFHTINYQDSRDVGSWYTNDAWLLPGPFNDDAYCDFAVVNHAAKRFSIMQSDGYGGFSIVTTPMGDFGNWLKDASKAF